MELQKGVKTMKAFIPKSNVRTAVKTELRNLAVARVLHCIVAGLSPIEKISAPANNVTLDVAVAK
ncbi:hypothetical protein OFM95_30735, partial [Escherichia coli]|nr:hypothetical protein [Escherichia coli]